MEPMTHEHGTSGKVYHYEGDFEIGDEAISWSAVVSQGGTPVQNFAGMIPITFPAMATLAEATVRDQIVKRIDAFDDAAHTGAAADRSVD